MKDKLLQIIVGLYIWLIALIIVVSDRYFSLSVREAAFFWILFFTIPLYTLVIKLRLAVTVASLSFALMIVSILVAARVALDPTAGNLGSSVGIEDVLLFKGERYLEGHSGMAVIYAIVIAIALRLLQETVMILFRVPRDKRPGNDDDEYAMKLGDVARRIEVYSRPTEIRGYKLESLLALIFIALSLVWYFWFS